MLNDAVDLSGDAGRPVFPAPLWSSVATPPSTKFCPGASADASLTAGAPLAGALRAPRSGEACCASLSRRSSMSGTALGPPPAAGSGTTVSGMTEPSGLIVSARGPSASSGGRESTSPANSERNAAPRSGSVPRCRSIAGAAVISRKGWMAMFVSTSADDGRSLTETGYRFFTGRRDYPRQLQRIGDTGG